MSHSSQAVVIPNTVRYELAEVLNIRDTVADAKCLITNDTEPIPNTAQMAPKDSEAKRPRVNMPFPTLPQTTEQASRIEYTLGITYESFNSLSTLDLFFLPPHTMHKTFESCCWVILPATEDLQDIKKHFGDAIKGHYD
ncbi:hypothetical protein BXZ70DRAFT_1068355 [Cristinia sonorae]|uniref:Uncharacterized protein n=1 Tax=Cristinia sonorae TaxID=1940300 RepID=A0A8K0UEB5_9AGAR|nr:hypothetical protein BXZ70DRAFT_1068355 [Cristinia sonorae]